MIDDPIVEEEHQVRAAIAAKFNHDLRAICDDARRRQIASGEKVVALPPRRVEPQSSQPTKKAG